MTDKDWKSTGINLYLALAKLEMILQHGGGVYLMPDSVITAGIRGFALAAVSDISAIPSDELESEQFTAKVVGELLVKVARLEGAVTIERGGGINVLLDAELSPELGVLLGQFNHCLGRVISHAAGAWGHAPLGGMIEEVSARGCRDRGSAGH